MVSSFLRFVSITLWLIHSHTHTHTRTYTHTRSYFHSPTSQTQQQAKDSRGAQYDIMISRVVVVVVVK